MEMVPFLYRDGFRKIFRVLLRVFVEAEEAADVAFLTELVVDLFRDVFAFFPFCYIGVYFSLDPIADFFSEGGVAFIVVWGVVLFVHQTDLCRAAGPTHALVPRWVSVGNKVTECV